MAIQTFPVGLEQVQTLAPGVRHFSFKRLDNQPFECIPGQFISIHFDAALARNKAAEPLLSGIESKPIRRSYSVATIPGASDLIEIAASYVQGGFASELLFNMEVSTRLDFSGPYGRLILRDEAIKRYFLVATGTGVTPYRAMLPQLMQKLDADACLEVWILLGVQYRADQLYPADFLAYAKQNPRLHFRVYHSRDALENPAAHEFKGHVQAAFDELKPDPHGDVFYLCGNPNMIDDSFELLKELGFSAQQVRREKYVS